MAGLARIGLSDGPHQLGTIEPALASDIAGGAIPPVPDPEALHVRGQARL
jgi:hypothetical protein